MSVEDEQIAQLEARLSRLEAYVRDLFMVACPETEKRLQALIASRETMGPRRQ